ncbi:Conjugal transfer protein TrbB [uncultured Desulfobacterium sp.]|uniref:Conjugal transfer protein TrbB n=1 Tax=uncultured Desulfobacterium sp. TaxID=201089 RepID=A0A445MSE8_9BACT|nr:Conjugal transfer protein TrbB [uncultured Desulfobacterium sp.]
MNEIELRRVTSLKSALEPIIPFLDDDSIIEIMLNPDGRIWLDQQSRGMFYSGVTMQPEASERMLRLIATSMGRTISETCPSLAAKLPVWGCRVQATIPPITEAPAFALRKPPKKIFTLEDYVERKIMTDAQRDFIISAVKERQNLLIGGGTGTGKTTLANAILEVISKTQDRVYIVEDNPELQCTAENKVQVLICPPLYDCRNAVMDALRYRPDRIIVGEVRDGSALDLLKAWNTGHPGGLATIHANNPKSMLDRMCQLIEEVVPIAPRTLVSEAIDLCVHMVRDPKHPAGRVISGIVAVKGVTQENTWHLENLL